MKELTTYFSPFCRSPTPFFKTISWRPQVTIPQPVAAYPFEYLVLAWSRAARPVHVLIYGCISISHATAENADLFLLSQRFDELRVRRRRHEIRPAVLEARVGCPARNFFLFSRKHASMARKSAYKNLREGVSHRKARANNDEPFMRRRLLPPCRKIYPSFRAREALDSEFPCARFRTPSVRVIPQTRTLQGAQIAPLAHHSESELISTLSSRLSTGAKGQTCRTNIP